MTGSRELVAAVRTTKQFLTYVASGPFQYAVAEALALPDAYYADFAADRLPTPYNLTDGLNNTRISSNDNHRSNLNTTDITELAPGTDALTFCRALPERCGVVAVPNSVFYDHPTAGRTQVRFAFCKRPEVLRDAADRLRKAFNG
ncbi:hypothetical protein ACI2LJ_37880 [Streptomyces sp. NPDC088090]|uniref:hypothetical protein n=1 Tax=Streptomyces sp. NPDC088090 TaxID=3365822 RepID=UPI00384CBF38